jgi:hypothetical protein
MLMLLNMYLCRVCCLLQAINEGKVVSRSFLVQNLVRNTNINLAGIGITLIGLQASGAFVTCSQCHVRCHIVGIVQLLWAGVGITLIGLQASGAL